MNMTRTWSDHYKLVILEKKGTKAQRHKAAKKEAKGKRCNPPD